jgi:hypothetical protein
MASVFFTLVCVWSFFPMLYAAFYQTIGILLLETIDADSFSFTPP